MQHSMHRREAPWIGGLILIAVGALMLATYVVPDVGLYVVVALGLVFLAAFAISRMFGFLVPGCILTGLGVGVLLTPQVPEGFMTGAVIVGSLAVGFAAIAVIAYLWRLPEAHPWPLIPAAILGTVAAFLVIDRPEALEYLNLVAAVALIIGGGWLFWRRRGEG